jgi:hypothetical protein
MAETNVPRIDQQADLSAIDRRIVTRGRSVARLDAERDHRSCDVDV